VLVLWTDNGIRTLLLALGLAIIGISRLHVVLHDNLENLRGERLWARRVTKTAMWRLVTRLVPTSAIVLERSLEAHAATLGHFRGVFPLAHPTYSHLLRPPRASVVPDHDRLQLLLVGQHAHEALRDGTLLRLLSAVAEVGCDSIEIALATERAEDARLIQAAANAFPGTVMRPLPRPRDMQGYFDMIERSDYVLLADSYASKRNASGVIADALSLGRPVVGMGGPSSQFIQEGGTPLASFLYEDDASLRQVVRRLCRANASSDEVRGAALALAERRALLPFRRSLLRALRGGATASPHSDD
jgi:hypothetical protein